MTTSTIYLHVTFETYVASSVVLHGELSTKQLIMT